MTKLSTITRKKTAGLLKLMGYNLTAEGVACGTYEPIKALEFVRRIYKHSDNVLAILDRAIELCEKEN